MEEIKHDCIYGVYYGWVNVAILLYFCMRRWLVINHFETFNIYLDELTIVFFEGIIVQFHYVYFVYDLQVIHNKYINFL